MARTLASSSQSAQASQAAKAAAASSQKQEASQKAQQRPAGTEKQEASQKASPGSNSRPKQKLTIVDTNASPCGQSQKPAPSGQSPKPAPSGQSQKPPPIGGSLGDVEDFPLITLAAPPKRLVQKVAVGKSAPTQPDKRPATSVEVESKPTKSHKKAKKSDGDQLKVVLKRSQSNDSAPSDAALLKRSASTATEAASTDEAPLKRAPSSDSKGAGPGVVKRSQSALSTAASSDAEQAKRGLPAPDTTTTNAGDTAAPDPPAAVSKPSVAAEAAPSKPSVAAEGELGAGGSKRADDARATGEGVEPDVKGTNGDSQVSAQSAGVREEAPKEELGDLLPCTKLPRGLKVSTKVTLPPPWAGPAANAGSADADSEAEAEVLLNVPALISFRALLVEQHPEAFRVPVEKAAACPPKAGGSRQSPDSPRSGDSAAGTQPENSQPSQKAPPGPPPTLANIGRRDPLGEAIRSMENRLARQGLLAAPASILGRKAANKAAGADAEYFYDPTDAFIDDADLEEVNAYDDIRAMANRHQNPNAKRLGAADHKKSRSKEGLEEDGDADDGSQHPEGKTDRAAQHLNLAAFRLSGAEVSGTSGEESGSDMDSDLEGAHRIGSKAPDDDRNWREQLGTLEKELVLVPNFALHCQPAGVGLSAPASPSRASLMPPGPSQPTSSAAPATASQGQATDTAAKDKAVAAGAAKVEVSHVSSDSSSVDIMDADADGADLTELRTALWDFGTSIEQAMRRRPRSSMQDAVEASIRAVWRRLPGLLRPVTSGPRPLRWKLTALEPYTADARYPGEVFPWDHVEEVAWGRFLWRLTKTAAPKIGRSSFVRRFVNAVREPQRELMGEAITSMRRQLRGTFSGNTRSIIETAVKKWQSEEDKVERNNHLPSLFPLAGTLKNLQRCWFRQRFWEEQRKTFRLRAPVRRLTQALLPCFSIYVVKHINDFVMLSLPMDMTMALVKDVILVLRPKQVRNKRTALKRSIIPKGYFLPLRLPMRIFIRLGERKLEALLQAVHTLDRQSVRLGEKQYRSMMQAAQDAFKELREKEHVSIPMRMANCLHQRHGAWTLWRFNCKMKIMPLTWALKLAWDRKIIAFVNPPSEPPCQPLPNPANPNKEQRVMLRERAQFLSDLCVGQWIKCLYEGGHYGLPSRHYNAQIIGVKSQADSSFRGRSILVDVEYVHGPKEEEVPVPRLRPVTIWEPDNIAAVRLSGQWWRGVVKKVIMAKEVSEMQFEVRLNDRTVTVPFRDMRQEYHRRSRREDPLKQLMGPSADSKPPKAEDKPQQRLLPGQHVKYSDRGCWVRGKVREDRGDRVAVVTHTGSGRAGGRDVPVVVTLERDQVVKLPGKTVKVKRPSRAGLKHTVAKRFRSLGVREDPIAVTDSDD